MSLFCTSIMRLLRFLDIASRCTASDNQKEWQELVAKAIYYLGCCVARKVFHNVQVEASAVLSCRSCSIIEQETCLSIALSPSIKRHEAHHHEDENHGAGTQWSEAGIKMGVLG